MVITPTVTDRLRHVLRVAALQPVGEPRLIESYSNDAWAVDDARLGPVVLRVSWRGDVERLRREVLVARHMPPGARYPEVLDFGRADLADFALSYSITRRLAGASLEHRWTSLTTKQRRAAVSQLAAMLREVHRWRPPAIVTEPLCARPDLADGIDGLLGADINPLPIDRALLLAAHARDVPHVDPGLMDAAAQLLGDCRHLELGIDDPYRHGLIHGDVNLSNLWYDESGTTVLLDMEWARFAPPLLDLQRLCEYADTDARAAVDTYPTILRWLVEDYPEVVEDDLAAERMRLYSLTYAIRHVIVDPPGRPPAQLPAHHSLHRLRRLVDGVWPEASALPEALRVPIG